MNKVLLYIDEDSMDEDFVQALRSRNVDVLTVADVRMLHKSDQEQLDWAKENDRKSSFWRTAKMIRSFLNNF